MLIALIDILIFLITGGLLITIIARIPTPLNIVCGVVVGIVLAIIAGALFSWTSVFLILYILWMLLIVGGLFGFRAWLRSSKSAHRR
ncbi:hypothetical protein [Lacticaseibacillus sp. GG6-2]